MSWRPSLTRVWPWTLEHSTCYNLNLLPADQRERVLESLVHPDLGLGINPMRICIGTSDFAPGPFDTYHDLPAGEGDPPQARFVEAYRREGIEIHAPTIQNEPEFGPAQYPSCLWTANQQRDFIRDCLGPLFRGSQLKTLIWVFDHNFNNPGFPAAILRDRQAARYVDGSAFHLYEGKPEAMSKLHREFPDKPIYFTEGSVYGCEEKTRQARFGQAAAGGGEAGLGRAAGEVNWSRPGQRLPHGPARASSCERTLPSTVPS